MILKSNCFAKKVNESAIMYAREGPDMNETVVIRNFFPNTVFKNFGFKGRNAARSLIVKFVALCQTANPDIEMTYGKKQFKDQIAALKSEIEEPVDIKDIYIKNSIENRLQSMKK